MQNLNNIDKREINELSMGNNVQMKTGLGGAVGGWWEAFQSAKTMSLESSKHSL